MSKVDKNQLKRLLKPLIKESIRELIMEEGILSSVVSECVKGVSTGILLAENKAPSNSSSLPKKNKTTKLELSRDESRKRLMKEIGSTSYNGLDLFEGTSLLREHESKGEDDPFNNTDPNDSGIDLSALGLGG